MRDEKIAVLLPCYNESATIAKVVRDFRAALPESDIYVYDNNSSDGTGEIARQAGAIVRIESVQGKGAVVRRMFREIDADVYLMADGDDTYPAESARDLINAVLERRADMAVGDRLSTTYFTENKRMFHNFGNSLVRFLLRVLFGSNTKDVMTGYRAFSYNFVKTFPVLSNGFEIETEMTAFAADRRMHVVDVPIEYRDRPDGSESKLNTTRDGIRVLWAIAALFRYTRPMAFFGIVSAFLAAISIGFFIPVLSEYFVTGLVRRFPTLIVSGFCMIGALQSLGCGLILASLKSKDRRDFEFRLQMAQHMRNRK